MEIKMLQQRELLPALHLAWEVFAEDIMPDCTPEGIEAFQRFIKYEKVLEDFQNREITFFGAMEEDTLCGISAVDYKGHICMLFVKKSYQKKGIGRMLYQAAYNFCAQELHMNRMTVNSAPKAVLAYQHMGMHPTDTEQVRDGICYVPMETFVSQTLVQPVQTGKSHKGLIIGIIIGIAVLLAALAVAGIFMFRNIYEQIEESNEPVYEDPYEDWYDDEDPLDPDGSFWYERGLDEGTEPMPEDGMAGIDAIPAYIADNLSYEIGEDNYSYTGEDTQTAIIGFDVSYPKLEGLEPSIQEKVNNEIKICAMKTVDEIYNKPSEQFKEKILGIESPMLVSYVEYKVSYASDEFISIILQDVGTKGKTSDHYQDLRTLNISLTDGKIYEVKDIVNLDDEFVSKWIKVMRSEAGDDKFLSELNKTEMKATLGGKSIDGNYKVNFFVDEAGLEIGYSLKYAPGDENDLGYAWVTAPFTFEEIAPYAKGGEFWTNFN